MFRYVANGHLQDLDPENTHSLRVESTHDCETFCYPISRERHQFGLTLRSRLTDQQSHVRVPEYILASNFVPQAILKLHGT